MVTALRFGQGHMSVGDSAEEFISVHALGRERLLVFYCGLPSHPLKILFLGPRLTKSTENRNSIFFYYFMKNTRKIQLWFLSRNGVVRSRK